MWGPPVQLLQFHAQSNHHTDRSSDRQSHCRLMCKTRVNISCYVAWDLDSFALFGLWSNSIFFTGRQNCNCMKQLPNCQSPCTFSSCPLDSTCCPCNCNTFVCIPDENRSDVIFSGLKNLQWIKEAWQNMKCIRCFKKLKFSGAVKSW